MAERCGARRSSATDSAPWILGRVNTPSGVVAARGRVNVTREVEPGSWEPIKDFFRVGSDGLFWICSGALRGVDQVRVEYRAPDRPAQRV